MSATNVRLRTVAQVLGGMIQEQVRPAVQVQVDVARPGGPERHRLWVWRKSLLDVNGHGPRMLCLRCDREAEADLRVWQEGWVADVHLLACWEHRVSVEKLADLITARTLGT